MNEPKLTQGTTIEFRCDTPLGVGIPVDWDGDEDTGTYFVLFDDGSIVPFPMDQVLIYQVFV